MDERRKRLTLLQEYKCFCIYACEACCGYPSIGFARRMEEVCKLEHGLWEYGAYREEHMESKQMYKFIDRLLLGSWTKKGLFRKRTWLKYIAFEFLCERLDSYLKKEETHFRVIMSVQEMITMPLHWLSCSDGFQSIGDLYRFHKNTLYKVVREFCKVFRNHLQTISMQNPIES